MKLQAASEGFLRFLNRNYCITSHLAERLDELKDLTLFAPFKKAIAAAIILLELQLNQTDQLFAIIETTNSFAGCEQIVALLEGAFTNIQAAGKSDLYLLDYVSLADHLMKQSADMAGLSLISLPELKFPQFSLYDVLTLQPLKALLETNAISI